MRIDMTTYFGLWKLNTTIPPPTDPKAGLQLILGFQAMLRQDLQSGDIKEAYSFLEGNAGYFLTGDITEEKLHADFLKWSPYVTFELHRTVPLLKSTEESVNVWRARASAMTIPA